ncbi:hypothetical protein KSI01_13910 [Kurthia sibirica]|uniref:DNA translocase FtsK n=1 Tax=Kurthia sibirica TaxID=202750 RepID=UPI001174C54B|nr:DNA translocase FtsK [Kurthia sibirica]GEK33858.1 hypothetical protein KSI01_13910 [Kurthia sibirica]
MSWFKQLFNKKNPEDQTDNEYEQYDDIKYTDHEQYYEDEYEEENKKTFKFPLVDDYDEEPVAKQYEQPSVKEEETLGDYTGPIASRRTTVTSTKDNYKPFGEPSPGVRAIVQKVDRANYNPFATKAVARPRTQVTNKNNRSDISTSPKIMPQSKNKAPNFEEQKRRAQEISTTSKEEVVQKKKFVPTDVPSPVFGFQKPPKQSVFNQLIEEKVEKERIRRTGTIADQLVQERLEREEHLKATKEAHQQHIQDHGHSVELAEAVRKIEVIAAAEAMVSVEVEEPTEAMVSVEVAKPAEVEELTEAEGTVEIEEPTEAEGSVEIEKPAEVVASVEIEEPTEAMVSVEIEKPAEVVESFEIEEPTEAEGSVEIEKPAEAMVSVEIEKPAEVVASVEVEELTEAEGTVEVEGLTEAVVSVVDKRISKTPINVVMLKSDKEKLNPVAATEKTAPNHASFPGWKKNPLKVMTAYKPVAITPVSKIDEEAAQDEVSPTENLATCFGELVEEQPMDDHHNASEERVIEEKSNVTIQIVETELAPIVEVEEEPVHWQSYAEAMTLLREPVAQTEDYEWMESQGQLLVEVLSEFNVEAEIIHIMQGPTVTQFEIRVGHGVKISKIKNLSDNLKLALAARDIRIEAPIPGKRSIGIEIPNAKARPVRISEILGTADFKDATSPLEVALGLDLTGKPVTFDLSAMPHGLIAGSTGSGKSVCINSILVSLLMKASPQDVKLLLIDPKMVELAVYDELPHLVSPVITDVKAATAALKWAVEEMERRYQLFHHMKVRHIKRYNEIVEEQRRFSLKMPFLVIVIDELADLMMMAPADVEESICRIAQKARACGIHLVLATQRPSVDVITGLIKSNIPTRIAFSVSSQIDSRTILDTQGAERLLGKGDMLYLGNGQSGAVRLQGTFVTDEEIEDITSYIRTLGKPNYSFEPEELVHKVEQQEEQDELFEEACRFIAEEESVSISSLQRKYRIGYNRAARLVEMMDKQGFISEARGTKSRDVFLTPQKADEIFS